MRGFGGKGFAVVANEVKELAKQIAKSTEEIGRKIAIQSDTKGAVDAIGTIAGVIHQLNDISRTIATAVEEQSATTSEMKRNVDEAACTERARSPRGIGEVARVADGTSFRAQESQRSAQELSEVAKLLSGLMAQFTIKRSMRGLSWRCRYC